MKLKLKYIKRYKVRGKMWTYFRRKGCKPVPLPDPESAEFHVAYTAALARNVPVMPGESRTGKGTVAALVGGWFASPDFTMRPASVREKHRRHAEAFRREHGDGPVASLDIEAVECMFAALAATPAKANEWRVAMRDLFRFAVRRKLIAINPADGLKKMASKRPDGHHTWTEAEVEQFRRKHAIGTRARLALELHLELALRRSDAIRLGPSHVRDGVITYTQHKMRERHPVEVVVEMPGALAHIITRTVPTGFQTWLVDGTGKPFKEDTYSHWFRDMVKAAGLPPGVCGPHGLRKRAAADLVEAGATSKEASAVTGHTTLKEIERYTAKANRTRLAAQAMAKRRAANVS
jgi:integrase